ncbi:MAG: ASKHA domain-containing protein [Desulfobacterium sp.]|nr:ASKHA domain-containing protein [Desulfobacterium sp.]
MNKGQGCVRIVTVPLPRLGNNIGDVERLIGVSKEELETDRVAISLEAMKALPALLRRCNHRIKLILSKESSGWNITGVQDPDAEEAVWGIALDMGTTRLVARLMDLETGRTLGEQGFDNPQIRIAPDVLARIHHAGRPGGLEELKSVLIHSINHSVRTLCEGAGCGVESVYSMVCAGNTAISHFFMGVDPSNIIREPYIPAVNVPGTLDARYLGLCINPGARVFVFPNIGSYFGGDLVAGILFSGIHKKENPSILVDVGTNAEVVLGTKEWLIACAGAAGPALEGGMSKMGMMAAPGVIDRVAIDPVSCGIKVHTIGDEPAVGICGSAMIDLAAGLFSSGMMDIRGKFARERCADRLVQEGGMDTFVLVPAEESGTGSPITLSQVDLNSLTSSKAAMYSILQIMVEHTAGMSFGDLDHFYVAGTFGSFIDPGSAISIGMLPDIPMDRFKVLGNSSLEGAALLMNNPDLLDEIEIIRQRLTYVELNVNQEFMNIFSGAKFYPHTDRSRFPSVTGYLP